MAPGTFPSHGSHGGIESNTTLSCLPPVWRFQDRSVQKVNLGIDHKKFLPYRIKYKLDLLYRKPRRFQRIKPAEYSAGFINHSQGTFLRTTGSSGHLLKWRYAGIRNSLQRPMLGVGKAGCAESQQLYKNKSYDRAYLHFKDTGQNSDLTVPHTLNTEAQHVDARPVG